MNHQMKALFLGLLVAASSLNIEAKIQTDTVESTAQHRQLLVYDFYDAAEELCDNGVDGVVDLGPCDTSRFPFCNEVICYNRKPSREHFWEDHHPKFYIQYNRVLCYPDSFRGCSSCTPGRYCLSENRCIMADLGYNCTQWY